MLQKLLNLERQITSKSFLLLTFLIGFSFSPTPEISRLELEFEESLLQNHVNFQRGDWTGVKWSSQSRKTNFLTLPDLAFGFVHKRFGNETSARVQEKEKQAMVQSGGLDSGRPKESHQAEANRCKIREAKTEMAR